MYKRIIIKIGTRALSKEDGQVDEVVLGSIVDQILTLKNDGVEVVLVTSGAVGSGRNLLQSTEDTETVADKQVFAAVGQIKLMETYAQLFEKQGYQCAQVLVTKEDFRDQSHYQNMQRCFLNLLRDGIVPIVNENDVVAIKELIFTDNDELAGLIAAQLEADAVIILTNVDGVLDSGVYGTAAKCIAEIDVTTIAEIQKNITNEKTVVGRGGMLTKLAVAKKLIASGIAVYIANGKKKNAALDIMKGHSVGTKFIPSKKISGAKRRLAYSDGLTMGAVIVNERAGNMLAAKKQIMSLLPVGIVRVEGEFQKGDVIEIKNISKKKIGFGVSALDSEKIRNIAGQKGGKAIVHYDYMFIE